MNTEKLEKLKKSLDNKFIPDNVKDKIRNEIMNLESEIKSEDITATELKKEVAKVEVAVEKAEKKAESTEPKKGRGRPKKTPATTPAEPKATETAIKKTAMSVAKTIRKDGEKWNDAMKRANGVMKKEKVEVKKTTKSELDRLLARVRKNKSLMSELKGVKDLGRDAVRTAKPVGKRMSESGNVYYEYRANKTDRKTYGKYAFAGGGGIGFKPYGKTKGKFKITYMADGKKQSEIWETMEMAIDNAKRYKRYDEFSEIEVFDESGKKIMALGGSVVTDLAGHTGGSFGTGNQGMLDGFSNTAYTGLVGETGAMSSGEMFMSGGGVDKNFDLSGYRKWKTFNNLEEAKEYVDMDRKKYPRVKESVVIKEGNKFQVWVIPATGIETGNRVYANGGGVDKWIGYDKDHLINMKNGMIVLRGTDLKDIKPKDIKGFDMLDYRGYADGGGLPAGAEQSYVNYYLGEGASAGIFKDGGAIENQYEGKTPAQVWSLWTEKQKEHFIKDHYRHFVREELTEKNLLSYSSFEYKELPRSVRLEVDLHVYKGQYAKGGGIRRVGGREYPLGRNWTNDHEHVNKGEEHEVNYTRKGKFLGVFAGGGSLSNEFKEVDDFGSEQYFIRDFGHVIIGDDKKIELVVVARLIDLEEFMSEDEIPSEGKFQIDFDLVPKSKYLTKSRKNLVNDEDNSISSVTEINVVNYMGGLRFEPSDKNLFKTFELAEKHLMSKELNDKISGMGVMSGFIMDMPYNRMGKTNWEQLNYILGLTDNYAKGGGVRQVGNREYSLGRNWTNDHRHTNKSEEHEVNYNRKRFFAGGGSVNDDTPKIYVADLEAYNNGRLSGVWLDLTDYSDADELMDAINDFLKTTGGEEYAVHDYENLPRSMYSEYMGVRDFEEIYEMLDLAKENDLPLDVVMEMVSQFDTMAVREHVGTFDSEQDFAEQLVDDLGGIQNFNDFEYYLEISDTDRRLLSQEMADGYVDDIRAEDGGNRLIEEAGLDVDEYEEADSDRQEEMLDEAREIVYDEYYNNYFEGLSDPYYFLVEEQGIYDAESFANANFVRVDYEKLADALEQDYTFIRHDGQIYVFNIR